MYHQIELAYLGIEVPDPPSLTPFFGEVIGLVPGDAVGAGRRSPGATTTRRTGSIVEAGDANDASFVGFEAVDDAAFDAVADRLRAAGFEVADGGTRSECAARGVDRLARTTAPWGVAVELVTGLAEAADAVRVAAGARRVPHRRRRLRPRACSPRPRSTSRTRSLVDGLGLAAVRLARDGARRRASSSRCASTTATSGTTRSRSAKAPFELPQTLHHVMFETNDRDDVGAAFDRAWATELADPERARPPRQRRHVQLLRRRARPGSRSRSATAPGSITDDWDDNRRYDRISAWGHQPLRQA